MCIRNRELLAPETNECRYENCVCLHQDDIDGCLEILVRPCHEDGWKNVDKDSRIQSESSSIPRQTLAM